MFLKQICRCAFFCVTAIVFATALQAEDDDNAFALEIYQQAVADGSCEMYQIVIDDYPDTTAARLARVKLRSCGEPDPAEPASEEPEFDEPAPGDPGFEHLEGADPAACLGYWTGSYCMSDKRELTKELQRAFRVQDCPVGAVDGVWGTRTSMVVRLYNRNFGENFRKSRPARNYGAVIRRLNSMSHSLCECEPGRVLYSDGVCRLDGSGGVSATCGWFALSTCSRRKAEARRAARDYRGRVIYTRLSEYPNFTPGYYCAVLGPMSKPAANREMHRFRLDGASSAYIKHSCR